MTDKIRVRHRERPLIACRLPDDEVGSASPLPPEPEDSDDYKVGYAKPPKQTRFRPGQTGNPKGRPKGSKNLKTLVEQELRQMVAIRENGSRSTVTKRKAIAKQLVKKAAEGQDRAIITLLKMDDELEAAATAAAAAPGAAPSNDQLDEEDQSVLDEFVAHLFDQYLDREPPLETSEYRDGRKDEGGSDET